MPSNPTKHLQTLALLLPVIAVSGCSKIPDVVADRILTDKNGCAFLLRKNIGDDMFVYRMKEQDRDTCKLGDIK